MDQELVSFDERPRWVEEPDELEGADHTQWTARASRGGRVAPRSGGHRAVRRTPTPQGEDRRGSQIAAMIPRPGVRSVPPQHVVASPPPRPPMSTGSSNLVAIAAGASVVAVFGTLLFGGVVIAAAIAISPMTFVSPSPGSDPNVVTLQRPAGGAPSSTVAGLPTASGGAAPLGAAGQGTDAPAPIPTMASGSPVPSPGVRLATGGISPSPAAAPSLAGVLVAPQAGVADDDGLSLPGRPVPVASSADEATAALLADLDRAPVRASSGEPIGEPVSTGTASEDSWLDTVVSVGSQIAAAVTGTPEPVSAPAPGTMTRPPPPSIASALPGASAPASVERSGAADAGIASAAAPGATSAVRTAPGTVPLAAPVAPVGSSVAEEAGWLDTVVAVGSQIAASMSGTSEVVEPITLGAPPSSASSMAGTTTRPPPPSSAGVVVPPSDAPLAPSAAAATAPGATAAGATAAAPAGSADLLAGDDGLDSLAAGLVADRGTGWTEASGSDDPAMRMLAELDGPAAPPVAARAPGTPAEDSWLDTVSSVGAQIAAAVTGATAPEPAPSLASAMGKGPSDLLAEDDGLGDLTSGLQAERSSGGWTTPAAANDPALAMLAELDAPATPSAAARGTSAAAAAPQGAAAAPAGTAAEDSWLDTVVSVGSQIASAVGGTPEPVAPVIRAPAPSLAAALPPGTAGGEIVADDGLDDLTAGLAADRNTPLPPSAASLATDALLADLDTPRPAPVAAPIPSAPMASAAAPAPAGVADEQGGGWLDTLSDVGSGIASMVSGAVPSLPSRSPEPSLASTIAASPSSSLAASLPGSSAERVAMDPGPTRVVTDPALAALAAGTAGSPSAASLSSARFPPSTIAALPSTSEGKPGVDLLADDDGLSALAVDGAADRTGGWGTASEKDDVALAMLAELEGPVAARPAPPAPVEDSWLDTVSSVGSGIASLVTGAEAPPPAAPKMAAGTRPTDIVADDGLGGLVADISSDRGSPAPSGTAAAESSWMDTMVSAGTQLVGAVVGGQEQGLAPIAPPTTRSAAAMAAAPPRAPGAAQGTPGVDLLDGEDGLDSLVAGLGAERTGWEAASAADDPALAMLAELDAPTVRPTADDRLPVGGAPAAGTSAAPSPGIAAAAPAGTAEAEDSWLDTMVSAAAVLVGGATDTPSAARVAAGTPGPAAPVQHTDLLAGDDGLDSLVASLGTDRTGGWGTQAAADDPALAMLAELDRPSGTASESSWLDTVASVGSGIASLVSGTSPAPSSPVMAAGTGPASVSSSPSLGGIVAASGTTGSGARSAGGTDLLAEDTPMGSLGTLVSDLGTDRVAPPTDPVALAMLAEIGRPEAPSAAGTADVAVASAPAPQSAVFSVPAPPVPVAPPKPVCADGELCGDHTLASWRDPMGTVDLLAADESDSFLESAQLVVAELFSTGDDGMGEEDLGGLESLNTMLLIIKTDVSGVPVQIDGKNIGNAPLVTEVAPGPHQVRLGGTSVTEFQLQATSDPVEWCFEGHGRSFRYVSCR